VPASRSPPGDQSPGEPSITTLRAHATALGDGQWLIQVIDAPKVSVAVKRLEDIELEVEKALRGHSHARRGVVYRIHVSLYH
jgi:hypothetical protein